MGGYPLETFLNNSPEPQDIEMKFLKMNFKYLEIICRMMTIVMARCCRGNCLLLKWKNEEPWQGVSSHSKCKIND